MSKPAKKQPAKKKRPRNPSVRGTWGNADTPLTVKDEEIFTGEGGGFFRFKAGKLVASHPAPMERRWTLEDSAYILMTMGQHGVPMEKDTHRQEDVARLAAGLVQAIHKGDHGILNRIADVMREPEKYLPRLAARWQMIASAVHTAATNAGAVPTREQVGEVLAAVTDPATDESIFPTARESDKLQAMLESVGFGWLPHAGRGEHLRRKQDP